MITLYQGPVVWGIPNLSPFCIKVETYLRMVSLPFQTRMADPRKAPKGKIPFIDDNGTVVADSGLILDYLKRRYGDPLDAPLTPVQRALGHAVRRMLEEGTYWVGLYDRYTEPANWATMKAVFAPLMPPVVGKAVLPLIRRRVRRALWVQGTGRHSPTEIYGLGQADIEALSTLLAAKPFLLGDEPTSVDATGYAFIVSLLGAPVQSPLLEYVATLPNLAAYRIRMEQRYFGERHAEGSGDPHVAVGQRVDTR